MTIARFVLEFRKAREENVGEVRWPSSIIMLLSKLLFP